MVDEVLLALHVTGEAAHAIVHGDDVRIELVDQVVERLQRRDHATGGYIDVHAERGDTRHRVDLRIGVNGDMALVEVRQDGLRQRAGGFLDLAVGGGHRLLGDQDGHARALGIVILAGDIEDVGTYDVDHIGEDLGQAFGVVLFVDVLDVGLLVLGGLCVADVIDVEAQGLGQVVEPVELEFAFHRWKLSCACGSAAWLSMPVSCARRSCVGRITPLRVGDCGRMFGARCPGKLEGGELCRRRAPPARVCRANMMAGCLHPTGHRSSQLRRRVRLSRSRG
ncbi:hypothetical protein D3C85_901700 [compost metagenome]